VTLALLSISLISFHLFLAQLDSSNPQIVNRELKGDRERMLAPTPSPTNDAIVVRRRFRGSTGA
jgi:hypothetical protein